MKKLKFIKLLSFILLFILLTSCSLVELNNSDMEPPKPGNLDIWKFWKFESAYSLTTKENITADEYYNKLTAVIQRDKVVIGADRMVDPNVKVTSVKTYDYFLNKYRIAPDDVGIKSEFSHVYSFTDSKGYSLKVFSLSEDRMALERNNVLIFFTKTNSIKDYEEEIPGENVENSFKNGVLLGLRGAREVKDGIEGPASLRTFWISCDKTGKVQVREVKDIIVPRTTFFKLHVEREENIDVIVENIVLEKISSGEIIKEIPPGKLISRFQNLTFVSNDYLSTISRIDNTKKKGPYQYFRTKNIDKLSISGTPLGDLFGPEGNQAYLDGASVAITGKENFSELKNNINEESYILERQNGSWVYKGRVNPTNDKSEVFIDFPISLRHNFRVFRYDDLKPQWARIKVLIPTAEDAISSPENFFTLVKTDKQLEVHLINESGEINMLSSAIIPITQGETIIMHEWATGNTVDEWDKVIEGLENKNKN